MTTPTLTRAAEMLEARAAELLLSNTNDDGAWNDGAEAREDHDEMLRVAGELRAMVEAAQPKHSAIERAIKTLTHVEDCLLRDAPDDIQAAEVERACAGLRESAHQADANTDLRSALNDALELRRQLTLMEEHARGEVWRWQGDGTDSLETMGNRMGVLIFASDLRALLEAAQPADVAPRKRQSPGERIEELRRKWPDILGEARQVFDDEFADKQIALPLDVSFGFWDGPFVKIADAAGRHICDVHGEEAAATMVACLEKLCSPADVALLQRALGALEYHCEQTRPIAQTDAVIEALRAAIDAARKAST